MIATFNRFAVLVDGGANLQRPKKQHTRKQKGNQVSAQRVQGNAKQNLKSKRGAAQKKKTKTNRTPSAAMQEVFGTNEILENILQHLQPKQLLQAKHVSRQFYFCIEGSLPLKNTLGLSSNLTLRYNVTPREYGADVFNPGASIGNGNLFKFKQTRQSDGMVALVSKKLPGLPYFRFTAPSDRSGTLTFWIKNQKDAKAIVQAYEAGVHYEEEDVCDPPLPLGVVLKFKLTRRGMDKYRYDDSKKYDMAAGRKLLPLGLVGFGKAVEELVGFCKVHGDELV